MPNKITIYLGASGAIGAIELEVPGLNDLYPVNANVAANARGRRVAPGEYILDSIAYTPKAREIQTAYGEAIIRFIGENENRLAIFGGEAAPDGSLLPTEGDSIRVGAEVLETIVNYIEEGGSETQLIVTDDDPGLISSVRIKKWYGQPANTGQIGFIRPRRFRGEEVDHTFYTDYGLDYADESDWLMWELLYYLDDDTASQTDFYQTYDEGWAGSEDGAEGSEEPPYIADPFMDIDQQNMTFESQSGVSGDTEIETDATADSSGMDEAPDNNY